MRVIAEVKKASPSAGIIRADFDAVRIAQAYERAGADCLSVLTDEHFFQGHLDYLVAVRAAVGLPVLRKDFLLDKYQVLEARAAGADCVLLIAECLDDCRMRELYFAARELEMDVLIELYEPENLDRVLKLEPDLVGVNNRNLRTFVTDLEHSVTLSRRVPGECVFVSESGIRTRGDVDRLLAAGMKRNECGGTGAGDSDGTLPRGGTLSGGVRRGGAVSRPAIRPSGDQLSPAGRDGAGSDVQAVDSLLPVSSWRPFVPVYAREVAGRGAAAGEEIGRGGGAHLQ
jgi:indole-3-glycerol phosphate synthase